jgi:type IV secretory pathway TraG/TraD family ATPase VirD4
MEAQLDLDDGQRDGIVGTAKASLRVLKYVSVQPWVKRTGPYDQRPYFDAEAFARSTDTLYLLSKEGGGSTAAITTALTVAVADAAEEYAMTQPRRRLPVPMLLALDEVANVCVWKELPGKYSHYGSKGLLPMAWLQSYSQGEELWGEKGMKKIYSASTVKVIGSGLDEDHLRSLSSSLNEYRYDTTNVSVGDRKSVSTSPDGGKEHIWTVGDLAELPKGRAIVKAAGSRAALVKTVQWIHTPNADAVWFSLELNDPTPESATAAATAEKRRTSWNLFQRLVLRKEGERPDELVAAYRAEKSKRAAVASAAASKWLEVAHD